MEYNILYLPRVFKFHINAHSLVIKYVYLCFLVLFNINLKFQKMQ